MIEIFFRNLARWDPTQRINGIRYGWDIASWSDAALATIGLYRAKTPDMIPEGKRPGSAVEWDGASVRYVLEDIPAEERRRVDKWTIVERLAAKGKGPAAKALLNAPGNEVAQFKWGVPIPSVFYDDPDTVAMIAALDEDPTEILAP